MLVRLIDFEAGILDYLRPIARKAGLEIGDDRLLASYATAEDEQHKLMPGEAFPQMMAPAYRRMAEELRLPVSDELAEGFRLSIPRWQAFPDSVAALQRLKKRFRLVAMTNSDNWALGHFAERLGNPFDDTVTAEDVGLNKPDPQFFAYARGRQSLQGYRLGDYLHVAQSQYHDIGVAKQLGYRTCWIERRQGLKGFGGTPTPRHVAQPDYHFNNLAGLADAVDAGN